jgi:transporter family-2 protein
MLKLLLPTILAAAAGVALVMQQALMTTLRSALSSNLWPGFASYFVGTLCMALLLVALREPIPPLAALARIPWWAWSAGMFGAVFIGLSILLVPQLGAATFFALLVAGQLIGSMVFDHFGILGLPVNPISLTRLLGAGLLIGGVLLIRF